MINNNLDYSKKSFAVLKGCTWVATRIAALIVKFKFSSKGFNKRTPEDTGDGPMNS